MITTTKKLKVGLLKEKLERLSGKKVFLKEADISPIMDRIDDKIKSSSNPYVQHDLELLRKFVDFNPETDTLIKAQYIKIKEALERFVKYNFGIPVRDFIKSVVERDGLTYSTPSEFAKSYGTKTENWYTILDVLLWGDRVLPKYVKMMNPLEKEIYDFINSPKPDSELYRNVKEKLALVKTRIVQREPKAVSVAREREVIKGALNPHLREVIDSIAEEFRKVVEEDTFTYYMKLAEDFKKDFSGNKATEDQYRKKYYKEINPRRGEWLDEELVKTGLIQRASDGGRELRPDVESFSRKKANEISHIIMAKFQAKMYDKLSGFLTELGKDFDVSYKGRLRTNEIHFKFTDGSRFSIRNQIVSHYKYPGGYYYSYPSTFHDAYLANNVKISQPSEYTIKKAFLGK